MDLSSPSIVSQERIVYTAPLKQERIVWADVLRFIAMFMVISVHCTDPLFNSPITSKITRQAY